MTQRTTDINGYIKIEKNPISRAGVFPYSGSQLPDADPSKVYNVYRAPEELSNPDTLKSFEMLPIINEHVMLGEGYETSAEEKGVHGMTGEKVSFENGILYSSVRIISDALKDLIDQGKKQLSAGYRCAFEKSSGVFNGTKYDYIQKNIRGNHIALVHTGRSGPDIAVLDGMAFDHFDIATGEDNMSKEILDAIAALNTKVSAMDEDMKAMKCKDEAEEEEKKKKAAEDEEEKKKKEAEDAEKDDDKKEGMDAAAVTAALDAAVKPLKDEIAALKAQGTKGVLSTITSRDTLARKVSEVTGTFDHSAMDVADVVAYGIDKLKITAPAGGEQIALEAFLAGRKDAAPAAVFALDTKPKEGSKLDQRLKA